MPQELHGKAKWLKLKRELTEDAKKIWIVAPIPRQYNKKVKAIEDGKVVEKVKTVKYNAYRYVYVYDISHTKGDAIPIQTQDINSNDMGYLYEKLISFSHIPVIEKELTGSCKGYYDSKKQEIAIKNTMSLMIRQQFFYMSLHIVYMMILIIQKIEIYLKYLLNQLPI